MKYVFVAVVLSILINLSAAGGSANRKWMATITFAANDAAILFIDGMPKAYVKEWTAIKEYRFEVKKGTVIAFKATNRHNWYGFIANVRIGKKNYPTGTRYWRATHGGVRTGKWMRKRRGFCWHRPMLVPPKRFRRCAKFPRRFKARYVWACQSSPGVRTITLLRFVVGGDGCGRKPIRGPHAPPTPTPASTPTSTPTSTPSPAAKTSIGGAGDEDNRTSCQCELVDNINGMCYYFDDPSARSGRCTSRECAASYQCREDGSILCIKKYVLEKVVPLLPDTKNCMIMKTRDPVWVPYSQQ